MEGNLSKNNPKTTYPTSLPNTTTGNEVKKTSVLEVNEASSNIPIKKTSAQISSDSIKKAEVFVAKEAKGDFYEIRTMQHDIDETKGKPVSSVNIARESLLKKTEQDQLVAKGLPRKMGSMDSTIKKTDSYGFKEGRIGEADAPNGFPVKSLLEQFKDLFRRRRPNFKTNNKRKSSLILTLIIIIFIGGIGYYFYNSGALSSIGGIGEMFSEWFNGLFNRPTIDNNTDSTSTPLIDNSTSSTVISTTTPTVEDDFTFSSAFFDPDEIEIIKLERLDDCYTELEKSFIVASSTENQFKRIVVGAKNTLATLNVAELWKSVKQLALGNEYSELISGEVIDNWGLAMPGNIYKALANEYNIFFYGQSQNNPRIVLIFKINDAQNLLNNLASWETTMLYDVKKMFLGAQHGEPSSETFLDNNYKDIAIRYLNLPEPDLTLDYAFMPDKNYLILTTSRESIWATIDKLLGSETSDTGNNLDISTWKTYQNQIYGFEIKYPETWELSFSGNGSNVHVFNPETLDLATNESNYPGDNFSVSIPQESVDIDGKSVTFAGKSVIDTGWQFSAVGNFPYRRIKVLTDPVILIDLNNATNNSKTIEEKMLSTFKFTK